MVYGIAAFGVQRYSTKFRITPFWNGESALD